MTDIGVTVPPLIREPTRAQAAIGSGVWFVVSLPFGYLASLYWNWPASVFLQWRGWVFAAAALACLVMATVVPVKFRLAILGTRVRGWADLV